MHPGEISNIQLPESEYIKVISEDDLLLNQISVNEIINAFDLLVTDYSSIGTEFLFLNKPVLYNVCDAEEYIKNRGILLGNLDFWLAGPSFNSFSSLILEMSKLLSDPLYFKKERDEKRNLWFGDLKSGGCKQICDFLFEENNISNNVKRYKSIRLDLEKSNNEYKNTINAQKETINRLTNSEIELNLIKNSKGWKLLEKARKVKNTITFWK